MGELPPTTLRPRIYLVLTVVINSNFRLKFSHEALNIGEVTAFLTLLLSSTLSGNVTACRRKRLKFVSYLYIYTYSTQAYI
jgi:hypothetical protein